MVGSSLYLTPEVFEGRIYNSKADMYSLGFVLWEIWYVSKPFKRRWQPADCISSKRWDRVVDLLTSKGPIIHGKYGNMSWLIPGMKIHVPCWQQKKTLGRFKELQEAENKPKLKPVPLPRSRSWPLSQSKTPPPTKPKPARRLNKQGGVSASYCKKAKAESVHFELKEKK